MRKIIVLALCAVVSGCVSNPRGNVTPISMAQLIEKVRCELLESAKTSDYLLNGGSVAANLTLETTSHGNFGPSLTPKDTLSTPGEVFSVALPFGVQSTTKRTYSQLFTIDLKTALKDACGSQTGLPVTGQIGVDDLVKEYAGTYAYLQGKQKSAGEKGIQIATIPDDKQALFSGSTDFTVKLSGGPAGPSWVLNNLTAVLNLTASYEAVGRLKLAFVDVSIDPPKAPVEQSGSAGVETQASKESPKMSPLINTAPAGFNLLLYNKDLLVD